MNQPWIILSLVCAFSLATSDALTKKALRPDNELLIAWLRFSLSLPAMIVYLLLSPMPQVDGTFVMAFSAALPLEILAVVLYIKALRISPLSMTLPFQSLTPLFLIFFSRLIVGEGVSSAGAAGITLIVLGGYVLNLATVKSGFLAPLKAVAKERGAVYMILVALIYSVTSSLGKLAVTHSSPSFFAATYYLALVLCLLPLVSRNTGNQRLTTALRHNIGLAALPAVFQAVMAITHYAAISLANVAYVISIKRSSLLIGSLYGFLFFQERQLGNRLAGAVLMFAGFVLIVLFN
jgi:drug/metabolite transporter (DMT)-like permease